MWFRRFAPAAALTAVAVCLGAVPPSPAQEGGKKKVDVDAMVEKGLDWLKRNQAPDGHWAAQGGQYPTSMTALAGMAMAMFRFLFKFNLPDSPFGWQVVAVGRKA